MVRDRVARAERALAFARHFDEGGAGARIAAAPHAAQHQVQASFRNNLRRFGRSLASGRKQARARQAGQVTRLSAFNAARLDPRVHVQGPYGIAIDDEPQRLSGDEGENRHQGDFRGARG